MEPAAKPRARRGTETRQKQERTTTRWNADDYAELLARADRAGKSVGDYLRCCAVGTPTMQGRRRAPVDILALAKLLGAVNKVGGNLHQLVKHLNFLGLPESGEVHAALRGYDQMVAAILAAMGPP